MRQKSLELTDIEPLVVEILAIQLDRPVTGDDLGRNFIEIGLDSIDAMMLSSGLEERLNRPIDPVLVFEATSVADFVRLVLMECQK